MLSPKPRRRNFYGGDVAKNGLVDALRYFTMVNHIFSFHPHALAGHNERRTICQYIEMRKQGNTMQNSIM